MNILIYCPFDFNLNMNHLDQLGGIETLNLELSKKLSNYNHNVFLATHCNKILRFKNLINIPIKKLSKTSYDFDIIISSNDSRIFNHFPNKKKILWLHNTLAIEKAIRKKLFFPIIFNRINTVFVSNYLKKITSNFYLFKKKIVVNNFLPKIFETTKRNYSRKKIFIWSVQRQKGLQETLDIWVNKINIKQKDIKLYIYGVPKKPFKNKLIYYKKKNIFFFDRVSKHKLKDIYNKSLAMICLGYDETFCLNALEANSCGLPIITFGKTALKDFTINNKNGFLINNYIDLENKILDLSVSKVNKDIINYCYNNSKKFYLNKIISQWLKVIKI